MRVRAVLLSLILLCAVPTALRAVELMLPVPTTDTAYAELRQLNRYGILIDGREKLLDEKNQRILTRYDIAFLLVEPLERCTALVDIQEAVRALPEQRHRAEIACATLSKLTPDETIAVLSILSRLLRSFGADINQLSPGLHQRATTALRKLMSPEFRPWHTHANNKDNPLIPVIHISVNPAAQTDSLNDPWLLLSPARSGRTPLFLRAPNDTEVKGLGAPAFLGSYPVSSLEAAADVAIGRFKLYGALATLPGEDPSLALLKPDGAGKAMFGLEIDLLRVHNFGISGIFEYHILRTGNPDNRDTSTGTVGGIGLKW